MVDGSWLMAQGGPAGDPGPPPPPRAMSLEPLTINNALINALFDYYIFSLMYQVVRIFRLGGLHFPLTHQHAGIKGSEKNSMPNEKPENRIRALTAAVMPLCEQLWQLCLAHGMGSPIKGVGCKF